MPLLPPTLQCHSTLLIQLRQWHSQEYLSRGFENIQGVFHDESGMKLQLSAGVPITSEVSHLTCENVTIRHSGLEPPGLPCLAKPLTTEVKWDSVFKDKHDAGVCSTFHWKRGCIARALHDYLTRDFHSKPSTTRVSYVSVSLVVAFHLQFQLCYLWHWHWHCYGYGAWSTRGNHSPQRRLSQ